MNINELISNLSKHTDEELRNLFRAICAVQQERDNEQKRKGIEATCEALKTLDGLLGQTVTVNIASDLGGRANGELDLLELCDVLREYLP